MDHQPGEVGREKKACREKKAGSGGHLAVSFLGSVFCCLSVGKDQIKSCALVLGKHLDILLSSEEKTMILH